MDFDQLITRYFGTDDLARLAPDRINAGVDGLRLQLGLEQDRGRRFALWCLLHGLGEAPTLDAAFKDQGDRDAARAFINSIERGGQDDQ